MVRRLFHTLALVATLLLVAPVAAVAYNVDTLTSDGQRGTVTVTPSTEFVEIRVGFSGSEPRPTRLRVNIGGDGDRVNAPCVRGDCRTTAFGGSAVFRLPFTARGGPFASPTDRIANGDVQLNIVADRAVGGATGLGNVTVRLDVPGSQVTSLSQSVSDQEVQLSWTPAPEAGISGYRVERITDGRTTEVTTTSGSSATDTPGPGDHRYRVVTVRPKAGSGVHEAASSTVTASVAAPPPPPPSDDDDGDEGSGGDGSGSNGGSGNGGSGNGSGSGSNGGSGGGTASAPDLGGSSSNGSNGSDDADEADDADEPEVAARERRERRTTSAPNVSSGRGGFGIPELPLVGDVFRGELDFGEDEGEGTGSGTRGEDADEVILSSPAGGGGSFLGVGGDDAQRIAIPIAGGLLLTAIGLHLWRWLKVPLA